MGVVAAPPTTVEAHLALSEDMVITAKARPGVVCIDRTGESPVCIEAPAGVPRSVALGRWMDHAVVVLEVANGAGWSWHYHDLETSTDLHHRRWADDRFGWGDVLRTDVPLRLAGIDNPEGDSLQLLLTEVTRPVRGWLWFHPCPVPGFDGVLQRIGGTP